MAGMYENTEYKLFARFSNTRVCEARSGEHPHGFFSYLDDSDCDLIDRAGLERKIGVYAEYNIEHLKISDLFQEYCKSISGFTVALALIKINNIHGRFTRACTLVSDRGLVKVMVVTQGGTEPDDNGYTVPRVNYLAYLYSNKEKLASDIVVFNSFIDHLEISD